MVQLGRLIHDINILGNTFVGVGKKETDIASNVAKNFVDNGIDIYLIKHI